MTLRTLTVIFLLCLNSSCFYYKLSTQSKPDLSHQEIIKALTQENRYLIVHFQDTIRPNEYVFYLIDDTCLHMTSASINIDSKMFKAMFDSLSKNHQLYVRRNEKGKRSKIYRPDPDLGVTSETHLFVNMTLDACLSNKGTIPFDAVSDIVVISKNKTKSTILTIATPIILAYSTFLVYEIIHAIVVSN